MVPARLAPGSWYALPQSPQLFKQLLQVGGFEKYYQIARCYRDEDFRADRQPEFTQLDIEASFVEQDDIIRLGESIVKALWKLIDVEIPTPIQRITYHDAMARYGSDKPDLRFGLELTELTEFFKDTNFGVFKAPYVGAVVMPGGASQARRALDAWQEWAKQRGAKGLAYVLYKEDGELTGPVAKNLTDTERAGLADAVGAKPGDCIFFAAGEKSPSRALLGAARVEIGHRTGLINPTDWAFVLGRRRPACSNRPPQPSLPATSPSVPASGPPCTTRSPRPSPSSWTASTRIPNRRCPTPTTSSATATKSAAAPSVSTESDVQERVFELMGLDKADAQTKFGFLLEGFKFGAPPHGGIAFGWDRVVALLAGVESIRDVIAFPKSGGGYDPLTQAPAPITAQQRKEAGVDFKPEAKKADASKAEDTKKAE